MDKPKGIEYQDLCVNLSLFFQLCYLTQTYSVCPLRAFYFFLLCSVYVGATVAATCNVCVDEQVIYMCPFNLN